MSFKRMLATGEYYHVFNRAAKKLPSFKERVDYVRFMFGIVNFQSPTPFSNIKRYVKGFNDDFGFDIDDKDFEHIISARYVELVGFCVMPNHFHLIVRQLVDKGIERYLHRVELSYARYANLKYDHTGHLFQGPYKSVPITSNEQLVYLSAYIHRNPRELKGWRGREDEYPWSSYRDYVKENRWGGLLAQEIIFDQFEGTPRSNYAGFVKSSPAKEIF